MWWFIIGRALIKLPNTLKWSLLQISSLCYHTATTYILEFLQFILLGSLQHVHHPHHPPESYHALHPFDPKRDPDTSWCSKSFFLFTLYISNSSRFRFKMKTLDRKINWKWWDWCVRGEENRADLCDQQFNLIFCISFFVFLYLFLRSKQSGFMWPKAPPARPLAPSLGFAATFGVEVMEVNQIWLTNHHCLTTTGMINKYNLILTQGHCSCLKIHLQI